MNTHSKSIMGQGEFKQSIQVPLEAAIKKFDGDPRQIFNRFLTHSRYADRVANFMIFDELKGPIHHKLAQDLIGENFFGVEEWRMFFGINFAKKQLEKIRKFPWGENILNAPCPFNKGKGIKETHFAFLGLESINGKPLTVLKWRELCCAAGGPKFSYAPSQWYDREKCATETTCRFRWYLMLKDIFPASDRVSYHDGLRLIPRNYKVPTAVEDTSKHLLYHKKTGILLNPDKVGRCNTLTSLGIRILIGSNREHEFDFSCGNDDRGRSGIGLPVSRRLPKLPKVMNP